jgi:hypothetical protein
MRKLAAQKLRALEHENKGLSEKLASSDRNIRCIKIARKMVDKGMLRDNIEDFFDKVADLSEVGNLDVIEAAVDIQLNGVPLGATSETEKAATESADQMEALIRNSMAV